MPLKGPGIAIRILGEVTPEQVAIARHADYIYIEEIKKAGLYRKISQGMHSWWQDRADLTLYNVNNTRLYAPVLLHALSTHSPAFAALLPVRSVGVMGDNRTYEQVIALRAVQTTDFMTADWYPMETEVLKRISSRIINEVKGVNRVVYDVSTKPPSTIEWE